MKDKYEEAANEYVLNELILFLSKSSEYKGVRLSDFKIGMLARSLLKSGIVSKDVVKQWWLTRTPPNN